MTHQSRIRQCVSDLPTHHVLARMRELADSAEFDLADLDHANFSATAVKAAWWVAEAGAERSEELARSYGITEEPR